MIAAAATSSVREGSSVNMRFLDPIWHVRGSLPLPPGQSADQAFDRLDPLFRQTGTRHDRTGDTLTFRKQDQPAQDRMSVFDAGVLRIERGTSGPVLRYAMTSRALLFCFLAPLLFLMFAQATIYFGKVEKPSVESAAKKAAAAKKAPTPLNPIDKALGAPEPDKPGKKAKKDEDEKPSPTAAYVFAGLFAALYVIGRVLESRRVKALFRRSLLGA